MHEESRDKIRGEDCPVGRIIFTPEDALDCFKGKFALGVNAKEYLRISELIKRYGKKVPGAIFDSESLYIFWGNTYVMVNGLAQIGMSQLEKNSSLVSMIRLYPSTSIKDLDLELGFQEK